ncbi:hypothetical protein EDB80DRAFT_868867 [Ilyonectria destructans]|nr:hypothetical protein EDB80DRAFT_868867 [Ilyonectria destructans]
MTQNTYAIAQDKFRQQCQGTSGQFHLATMVDWCLTALLTTFLTTALLESLYALANDRESIWTQTLIFKGRR